MTCSAVGSLKSFAAMIAAVAAYGCGSSDQPSGPKDASLDRRR